MLLAEFYSQQLKRQNATKIELISGEPIRFTLPSGTRQANAPLRHSQVVQLIEEISTPEQLAQLKTTGHASLTYPQSNPKVSLNVEYLNEDSWKVSVTPSQVSPPERVPVAVGAGAAPSQAPIGRYGNSASASPSANPTFSNPNPTPVTASAVPSTPNPMQAASAAPPAAPAAPVAPVSQAQPSLSEQPKPKPSPAAVAGEPRLNAYLRKMMELGASDLHMSSNMPPLVRLDGEMKPLDSDEALSKEALESILMEVIPEKNGAEFKETWDTDFAHAIPGLARFRANYFMDQNGIGAVFRQIPFEILSVDKLGLSQEVLDLCWLSKGLVLVTGPTGSGKSTTLAAMINYINENRSDHIITIEDPVEFVHPNKKCLVNQREIGTHTKSFKTALRAALREDPDIVLVGEMRDLETIAIAIETAETGHLVFGTLHTTTAPSTVDRLIDQFPADQQAQVRTMLAESLKGVIAQVLCKKKEKGRAAAYEVMIANSAISNNIREGKTHQLKSLMQTGKNQGMCTMNDSLLALVESGQVDAKEAYIKSVDKKGLKLMFDSKGIKLELERDVE